MIPIGAREPQSRYVERVLRTEGRISARDVLYGLTDESGRKRGITRLAAIIEPLRKAGWQIDTEGGHGELATYVVRLLPSVAPRCHCGRELHTVEATVSPLYVTGRCQEHGRQTVRALQSAE